MRKNRPILFLQMLLLSAVMTPLSAWAQWSPPGGPDLEYHWGGIRNEICENMYIGGVMFGPPGIQLATNMLLDKHGDLVWYNQSPSTLLDFKAHATGHLSFYNNSTFFVLDSTFSIVEQLGCVFSGTDVHDLILRDDGHRWIICLEDTVLDASGLNTVNGTPGATQCLVTAGVIREMDENMNVVKEWSGFDHYTMADSDTNFFTNPGVLDLNHTNSITLNDDGLMLISQRHNHEVALIDWNTGNVIWRLGGPQNDFAMAPGDAFNSQHDARFLSADGSRISVFDNGTYNDPATVRAMIFELDTASMTATVTSSITVPGLTSAGMGSYQLLSNGDHLINWGRLAPQTQANVTLMDSSQNLIFELDLEEDFYTYRAQCMALPFDPKQPEIVCSEQGGQIVLGLDSAYSQYIWTNGETTSSITLADTGKYQVFVPRGAGKIGSKVYHITDLSAGCLSVSSVAPQVAPVRPPKLVARYDVMGREADEKLAGKLYFELYDDGSVRKVIYDKN